MTYGAQNYLLTYCLLASGADIVIASATCAGGDNVLTRVFCLSVSGITGKVLGEFSQSFGNKVDDERDKC